jgi:hypothetical protein
LSGERKSGAFVSTDGAGFPKLSDDAIQLLERRNLDRRSDDFDRQL